jgi:radical SAM-linked protein
LHIRAEYRVGPGLRFLSNLEMKHLMERALRRANLPFAISKGYNPQIRLSMGTVLPVGLWGEKEYLDLELENNLELDDFKSRLQTALPAELTVTECIEISPATPSLMNSINTAVYSFLLKDVQVNLEGWKEQILNAPSLIIKSKGKNKDRDKDLKPGIYSINLAPDRIDFWVKSGEGNIRYDELLELITRTGISCKSIMDVFRSGNYIKKDLNYFTPLEKVI